GLLAPAAPAGFGGCCRGGRRGVFIPAGGGGGRPQGPALFFPALFIVGFLSPPQGLTRVRANDAAANRASSRPWRMRLIPRSRLRIGRCGHGDQAEERDPPQ